MADQPKYIILHSDSEPGRVVQQPPDKEVPLRVRVAMHFVEHVTHKVEVRALPVKKGFDDSAEWEPLPTVKLNDRESDTYHAALELLEQYFNGGMKESSLEIVERTREEEKEKRALLNGGPVLVMDCPQCGGGPNAYRCLLCRTKGKITVGMIP